MGAIPCHKPALSDTRLLLHCPPPYPAIRWERGMESELEEKKRQIDEGRWHLRHVVRAEEDRRGRRRRNLASASATSLGSPGHKLISRRPLISFGAQTSETDFHCWSLIHVCHTLLDFCTIVPTAVQWPQIGMKAEPGLRHFSFNP